MLEKLEQQYFTGERSLFQGKDLYIKDSIFEDGESPLKHSHNITIDQSAFRWKYPLWYSRDIQMTNSTLFETARAGIWYTDNVRMTDCLIQAPKAFRRCQGVNLNHVFIPNAVETLWNCNDVCLENVVASGDYFGMNCSNVTLTDFTLYGNYCFDGAQNVEVHNSQFLSKDCFWNAHHITIYDSYISGEYFAWNSSDITLVNCTVESLQGMCYIDGLVMRECKLLHTTLAFEYSNIDVEIMSRIESIKNPSAGRIVSYGIDELILEEDQVDITKTTVEVVSAAV